ncbi:MAG: citramalate synthase, partial [Vicinamibacteria bacterium]
MPKRRIRIYDTLLRDGTQAEDISFTVEDKLRVARKFDELGIDYIEGGWPGSNPRDIEFFEKIRRTKLSHAKIAAFAMTRRAGVKCEADPGLEELIRAGTPVATIVGKSWDLHVRDVLKISEEENLELIYDTIAYLAKHFDEVMYDAEHYFDGLRARSDYALRTLRAAEEGGAAWIVLCDTNGGSMPAGITEGVRTARGAVRTPLGIHCHNDAEMAVANSLAAVEAGADQVQGTVNGFGERCGNANLTSIIPNLRL